MRPIAIPAAAIMVEDTIMDDEQVYLEKISAFSRMLRLKGLSSGPQEAVDACRILLEIGFEDRMLVGIVYDEENKQIFTNAYDFNEIICITNIDL